MRASRGARSARRDTSNSIRPADGVDRNREHELVTLVEDLRCRLAGIDAYATAAEEVLQRIPWELPPTHRRAFNRLSHLLGDAVQAASAAIEETDERLAAVMQGKRRALATRVR